MIILKKLLPFVLWKKIDEKNLRQKLLEIVVKLSDKETGFGGNIMKLRVGTSFPSPKQAVEETN